MWKNRVLALVQQSKNFSFSTRRNLQQATAVEIKDSKKTNLLDTNVYLSVTKPSTVQPLQGTQAVAYDDIPGPLTLKVVAKFWEIIPNVGTEMTISLLYSLMSGSFGVNSKSVLKKFFDRYGPIVKLHGAMGRDVVLLSRPEHARIILDQENNTLFRSCMDSLDKYCREFRVCKYIEPFSITGVDWDTIIRTIEEPTEATVFKHQRRVEEICDDFIQRMLMVRNTQEEVPNDFKTEILKWSLECLSHVTLNKNLGFLNPEGVNITSDGGRLLTSISTTRDALRRCEHGVHLWRFLETPSWKSLVNNCHDIDDILFKYLENAINCIRDKKMKNANFKEAPTIEYMLLKEKLLPDDVMTILLDMFLVGASATTHTVQQLLYHLSKNTRCQIKVHEEISKHSIDTDMRKLPYLQACIKECQRIDPPISIMNRVLSNDVIIHHYRIPKGTPVLFATHLNNFREEYFEDAHKFKPERWISSDLSSEYQGYATIPFGYGPKSCMAKELAEMEIGMLLYQIYKRFRVEYNYGELKGSKDLFSSPSRPLKFRFVERKY
ncbi:unnamed protein product [Acanthoscelides obtectus]|uniref:Cytochrome P450 n=1 Tax=Acanthoscelides obtectus TaxID=200917 RepID=A0A9P0M0G7_ACAOB|nr:unnamed protein product [Acanthoscelides obtectus]CAK1677619.1 Probable cytochrome P450 301a1, mitochondrial [Acanthoscelides obtectus]